MGIQTVTTSQNPEHKMQFSRALLRDLDALQYLLQNDWFENNITRIGAEQEVFLVKNGNLKPAPISQTILSALQDKPWLKAELARFNLETNLSPRELSGDCFSAMETENREYLTTIRKVAQCHGADVLLTGILPTLCQHDLELHNLTPNARSQAVLQATVEQLVDGKFKFHIAGIDELVFQSTSPLYPASNTSFQVHLQVSSHHFAQYYNIAQALAAPVLAIASNSPIAFGKRLWHESRMTLYKQASDTTRTAGHPRKPRSRVIFGDDWVNESVLEIFREDIARFPALLNSVAEEDPFLRIEEGLTPSLNALQIHNSTIYRWNRPCYGISPSGKPHLRIENRMLPAGATSVDEIANAALWSGAMIGLANKTADIRSLISFVDAKENFRKAAQYGIESELTWLGRRKISTQDLLLKEILPLAREGLASQNVDPADTDFYLDIIAQRAQSRTTGAVWMLNGYNELLKSTPQHQALIHLTSTMLHNQWTQQPVHEWKMPHTSPAGQTQRCDLKVADLMDASPVTVHPDDSLALALHIMDWRKTGFLLVEDAAHQYRGYLLKDEIKACLQQFELASVQDVLRTNVQQISPEMELPDVAELRHHQTTPCLPVVKDGLLVGLIDCNSLETGHEFA